VSVPAPARRGVPDRDHVRKLFRTHREQPDDAIRQELIEIHLGLVPAQDQRVNSAYLFVDDADVLAEEWRSAGVEVHSPQDTEWGQHEGAVVDPDGNVIRFGSPM